MYTVFLAGRKRNGSRKMGRCALTLVLLIGCWGLTGCLGDRASETQDPMTLTFYGPFVNETIFKQEIGDRLAKQFPNITFKYLRPSSHSDLNDYIENNETIDVMMEYSYYSIPEFIRLGYCEDYRMTNRL